jgi:PKD repeat protein
VYVAARYGDFSIFDISNPSSPFLKGSYEAAGGICDFSVSGDYVYIASYYDGLYIFKTNLEQTPLPIADFNVNTTYGYNPLCIQFTDKSGNTNGWNWNFGDEATSNEQNPNHTYSKSGIYIVSLSVSNANGISYPVTKEICVGYWNLSPVCMPNISVQPTAGNKTQSTVNNTQNKTGYIVANIEQITEQENSTTTPAKESKKTPGFGIASGFVCLLSIFLYKRR